MCSFWSISEESNMIVESDRKHRNCIPPPNAGIGNTMYKVLSVTLVLAYGVGPQ
jgi:hypothetical protein